MKRIIVFLILLLNLLLFCSCDKNIRRDEKYIGKWIAVAGEISEMPLSGDEIEDFYIELKKGGKATVFFQERKYNGKWCNDETTLTLKIKKAEFNCKTGQNFFVFENVFNTDFSITYAKEGTTAASPEQYIPKNAKKMIGKWYSVSMSDILGEKPSEEKSLVMDFSPYYTVDIFLNGEKYKTQRWYLSENFGGLKDSDYDISWEKGADSIDVCVLIDGEYYIFKCVK